MRAYIHVGMPKAGSTTIQLGLSAHETDFLGNYGIHYGPLDRSFQNDFELYRAYASGKREWVRDLISKKRQAASEAGAQKVVFSCERFFELADQSEKYGEFICSFADIFDGSIEFIIVYRDLRSFIKSYTTQLIYNGGITFNNMRLASWIMRSLRYHYDLPFRVAIINFNFAKKNNNLFNTFLELVAAQPCHESERYENITPNRPVAYASILGQICKLEALLLEEDINSRQIDVVRTSISREFDRLWNESPEGSEEKKLFSQLNQILEGSIERYIEKSIELMSEPERALMDALDSAKVLVNEERGAFQQGG
jgi:hypothetical protein